MFWPCTRTRSLLTVVPKGYSGARGPTSAVPAVTVNSRSGAAERVKALGLWCGILAALLALMLISPSALAGTKILVAASDYSANENDVVSKLNGTGLFSQVDLMDLQHCTPCRDGMDE